MERVLGYIALAGFVLSLAVHVSALLGVDLSAAAPYVWLLHGGVFVVFIPLVIFSRKQLGARPRLSEIRAVFPRWTIAAGIAVAAYTLVNFVLFMAATEGGSPAIHEGTYVLQNHGHILRELTAAEYAAFKTNEVRGFSGHWLLFYFVPFAYFMFRRQTQPARGTPPA